MREELRRIVSELIADYADSERGMEIREIAGGYRVGTKPEYHDAVRGFVKSLKPPMKLSLQALETLAVIAYKQPVTAPEVGEIRGVDSAGVIGSLISRKLITTAGRKQVIGRPILYKTTKEFLLRFGLKDLNELPSIEEFEKMAAGELAESEELPLRARLCRMRKGFWERILPMQRTRRNLRASKKPGCTLRSRWRMRPRMRVRTFPASWLNWRSRAKKLRSSMNLTVGKLRPSGWKRNHE